MTSVTLPRSDAALVQDGGLPTREYHGFFRDLATTIQVSANQSQEIGALTIRVEGLENAESEQIGNVVGASSVVTDGVLHGGVVTVHLLNDVGVAPALSFYGALTAGAKGWQTYSGNFAVLSNGDGTTSLDLADLADSGAGAALVKITRDTKGRISGTSAASTTDLDEGTNLYYTDARADARIPPGYIDGLQMQWVSGTAITVTSGAAYVEGAGKVLRAPSAIAKTGLSLAASTWYHVYLYDNAGTPAVEIVATTPATPYNGMARSKTGDTSRRYVGSVLTDSSSNISKFLQSGNAVMYETSIATAPFLVVSTGRAMSVTNVACGGAVPITAKIGAVIMATINATADAAIGNADMVGTLSSSNYLQYVGNGVQTTHSIPLDSSQRFSYVMTASTSTGGFFARVCGYVMER